MRHYEIIYIINPDVSEDDNKQIIEKFNKFVQTQNGIIIKSKEWGKQKLAYNIKKHDKGTFYYIEYCADSGVTAELERALNLDDRILKFQTVKLSDKADPEELLQKAKNADKAVPTEEKQKVYDEETDQQEFHEIDNEEEEEEDDI
ncbi:MAG: 30S ribosomal protein S6 [Deltaproteobacteria bacterium]|nr:30S ribosomal protein S6 [Deltaproteobacteria bacterium]